MDECKMQDVKLTRQMNGQIAIIFQKASMSCNRTHYTYPLSPYNTGSAYARRYVITKKIANK